MESLNNVDMNKILTFIVEKGDVVQLEKMIEWQERNEAKEARKLYLVAMAAFKADPPKIIKDVQAEGYKHAKLANVSSEINAALSKHALSVSWDMEQDGLNISVTCKITHIAGHFETSTFEAERDDTDGKNKIQAVCSTVSYLERYSLLALAGLAAQDDDDGKDSSVEYINKEQLSTINKLIESTKTDFKKFKKYMAIEDIGKILATDYDKAITGLKTKKTSKKKVAK
ncbi:ERF family protein [Candidatus Pacearchaeota archaeon]|nr:ERF family protein [Candidatus Pacearchaeota archaeon]